MGNAFFPIPPSELVNRSIPLDEILPRESERIKERLLFSKTFQERIYVFEKLLEVRTALLERIPDRFLSLIEAIHHNSGYFRNEKLARCICYSDRNIRRLFLKYIGVSPKLYASVVRHQKTLRALNLNPHQDLAGLAFEQGYYDQSHFIKEFKRFQGSTPVQFISKSIRIR
jgi:AraC-like DNA-binding protein